MARAKRPPKVDASVEPPRLGALSNLFRGRPEEVAARFVRYQLESVQILPNFVGLRLATAGDVKARVCREMSAPFLDAGLLVAAVSAHTNFLDPDAARRRKMVRRFDALIEHCREFGSTYLVTETGTLKADRPWEECPENGRSEAFRLFLDRIAPSVKLAAKAKVVILLEGYLHHVVFSVERAREVREALGEHIGFVMDPVNYFTRSMSKSTAKALRNVFEAIGEWSPVAHAKDVRYTSGELTTPRAGAGHLDYKTYLELLDDYQPGCPMIFEQIRPDEIRESIDFIDRFFDYADST